MHERFTRVLFSCTRQTWLYLSPLHFHLYPRATNYLATLIAVHYKTAVGTSDKLVNKEPDAGKYQWECFKMHPY
jgi:hypothetical protein